MKKTVLCAAFVLFSSTLLFAAEGKRGVQISFDTHDPHAHLGDRIVPRDTRLAITTRDGSTVLVLTNQVVAVQLADRTIHDIKSDDSDGILGEMLVSSIRTLMNKSISFPVTYVRSAELVDGALVLTGDDGKPLFSNVKVDGEDVMRDFAIGDAARFVNALRASKKQR